MKKTALALCAALLPVPVFAGPFAGMTADVVVLGEVHDNPAHHVAQAEAVADVAPTAVVFEMLRPEQAAAYDPALVGDEAALSEALGWNGSGWPDFAMYYPIFESLKGAQVYGAQVPRDQARAALEAGVAQSFGDGAEAFGLTDPVPEAEMEARLALQSTAHCGMMPEEMLPMMIEMQRLRDATLARATMEALQATGGPVVVITGNGHARADWGLPAYLARLAPGVVVRTLGQSEDGVVPEGGFDVVLDAPAPPREDPCLAFE